MNGYVDAGGRALLEVRLRPPDGPQVSTATAWIDTGFTGDLVLPERVIQDLSLPLSGTVGAVLADGTQVAMRTYSCLIQWFGGWQHLEVVASEAEYPLLGVGLMLDRKLIIDYSAKSVTLD